MTNLTALADALDSAARKLTYNDRPEEAAAKHLLFEQAMRLRTLAAADAGMPVVAWLHLAPNSTAVVTTRPPAGFDPQDLADAEVVVTRLVRQSDAQAAVLAAYEAGEAAAEKEVRLKVVQELRSSAFLHCDVNKEHVLLCIKHGTTLIEALKKEQEPHHD